MTRVSVVFFGRKMGFTLTEILVVVIIIGILATLALPMLVKTLEKAKVGEAMSNLNLIRTGQKIYFLEWSNFSGDIANLNIEDPNDAASRYFEYDITTTYNPDDFSAEAVRKDGPRKDDTYTIHKDGRIEGPLI